MLLAFFTDSEKLQGVSSNFECRSLAHLFKKEFFGEKDVFNLSTVFTDKVVMVLFAFKLKSGFIIIKLYFVNEPKLEKVF